MRSNVLFFAGFLSSAIVAQSGAASGSGFAHPTALPHQNTTSTRWNATHPVSHNSSTNTTSPIRVHQAAPSGYATGLNTRPSADTTSLYIVSSNDPKTAEHTPYTKSSGLYFSNTTQGSSYPTGSGRPVLSGTAPPHLYTAPIDSTSAESSEAISSRFHLSHTKGVAASFTNSTSGHAATGVAHASGTAPSAGFAYSTSGADGAKVVSAITTVPTGTGRLPYSQGTAAHFTNATSGHAGPTRSGVVHASGTGVSSGFAKSTVVEELTSLGSTSTTLVLPTGKLPFSKGNGAHFVNSTSSGTAGPKGTGFNGHASGTGVSVRLGQASGTSVSLGFARPTGSSNFTNPASNSSVSASASGRLPFTRGSGVFANSTYGVAQASGTGFARPSGTAISSGFAKPTEESKYIAPAVNNTKIVSTTGRLPFKSTSSIYYANSTTPGGTVVTKIASSGVQPTGLATGIFSSGAVVSLGRLPYTKSSGHVFTNYTSNTFAPATRISASGVTPSGSLPTGIFSTGAPVSESGRLPYTKTAGFFSNSTASAHVSAVSSGVLPTGALPTGIFASGALTSASSRLPFTKPSGAFFNSTAATKTSIATSSGFSSGVLPTRFFSNEALPTSVFSSGSVATGTRLPFSKPSGPLLVDSTRSVLPTSGLPTSIFLTGSYATGTGYPVSTPAASSNATSTIVPSTSTALPFESANITSTATPLSPSVATSSSVPTSSSATKKSIRFHHKQTVTVTIAASPVTVTVGGLTVTTTQFQTPSATSSILSSTSGTASEETTTVTVVESATSLAFSASVTSLATAKVQIPTSYSNSTLPTSTTIASPSISNSTVTASSMTSSSTSPSSTLLTSSSTLTSSSASQPTSTLITKASSSTIATSISASTSATASVVTVPEYYQCGGLNWTGATTCAEGTVCKKWNPYYSQCVDLRDA